MRNRRLYRKAIKTLIEFIIVGAVLIAYMIIPALLVEWICGGGGLL